MTYDHTLSMPFIWIIIINQRWSSDHVEGMTYCLGLDRMKGGGLMALVDGDMG